MSSRLIEECFITEHLENIFLPILLVDPTLVNLDDLKNLGPGRLIRVRKRFVKGAFQWLSTEEGR